MLKFKIWKKSKKFINCKSIPNWISTVKTNSNLMAQPILNWISLSDLESAEF